MGPVSWGLRDNFLGELGNMTAEQHGRFEIKVEWGEIGVIVKIAGYPSENRSFVVGMAADITGLVACVRESKGIL